MEALVFTGPSQAAWRSVPVSASQGRDVLVRVQRLGICGTDVHLFDGSSAYLREGLTPYPMRPGHEWCGTVVAAAPDVPEVAVGDRVVGDPFLACGECAVCRGGRQNLCPQRSELGVRGTVPGAAATYLRVPVSNVARVPDGVSTEHAVLAEPAITALNALRATGLQAGERVAVIGTGTLGLLAVQAATGGGGRVDVVGIDEAGLKLALEEGAGRAYGPGEAPEESYDVVVEASGAAPVTPELTRIAAIGARIAQVGIPGAPTCQVDLSAFVMKGLTLTGILGGVSLIPRALELIDRRVLRPGALIDAVVPRAEAADALHAMQAPGRARPKILVNLEAA